MLYYVKKNEQTNKVISFIQIKILYIENIDIKQTTIDVRTHENVLLLAQTHKNSMSWVRMRNTSNFILGLELTKGRDT